ncbi:fructoselysine 6-kinase [Bacillus salipaludis]|uniref:Fructoselysine 6-kinase n=1 Tax=Bacillus salipaludis TaxID=2547811 RepID=A0A4R5VNN9_9BACI|nr:fructoselysine 6-kinase [Bacillus salipaludis]MDQ6595726.1 fructoselysine 6-kinase [Bacillus salipaludis]TDK59932.1 fructoselysine 6-kinase [Bacillus salipaludis]
MRIVTVGDNCMDVYLASGKAYPGGNPVNVAVYLKELGADSSYIGWVGNDQYGDQMIEAVQGKGVDTTFLAKKDGKTAVTHVELIDNDRRFGDYDEGVMAQFTLTDDELEFIHTHQLVHAGIWGHVEWYYPLFKQKGLLTAFDFSDQLEHGLVKTLPAFVDYSFFSYIKDDEYIRGFLKEVKKQGSRVAVATLGENGSIAYDGEQFYQCGVLEADVVDTMGAGDSFISGFIYGTLQGQSIQQCLTLGTKTAAKTIRYFGAW